MRMKQELFEKNMRKKFHDISKWYKSGNVGHVTLVVFTGTPVLAPYHLSVDEIYRCQIF